MERFPAGCTSCTNSASSPQLTKMPSSPCTFNTFPGSAEQSCVTFCARQIFSRLPATNVAAPGFGFNARIWFAILEAGNSQFNISSSRASGGAQLAKESSCGLRGASPPLLIAFIVRFNRSAPFCANRRDSVPEVSSDRTFSSSCKIISPVSTPPPTYT